MAKNGGSVVFTFEADDSKVNSAMSGLGNGLKTAAGVGIAAVGALSAAITGVVTAGVNSYASLEQNIGGIETLFKDSADTVIANAKRAYETAGMSANQYMETITSFSASLLQGLGGDTKEAAKVADMAVKDMSDNANKMGTDINTIILTYQSLARGNYAMLDNLKLGYGGTKTELERLVADASKLSGLKLDPANFSDVIQAIHIVQENLDITGTTSKEAATTITGSMNSAKAAWDNFLNGTGDASTFSDTLVTALTNIGNAVGEVAPRVLDGLMQLANNLIPQIPGLIQQFGPSVINGAMQLLTSLTSSLPQFATALINMFMQVVQLVVPQIPTIAQNLITALLNIGNTLVQQLPTLIPKIVEGIIGLLDVFNQNFDQFLLMGAKLILGLIQGLIGSIPTILSNLPTILMAIVNFFTISKFLSIGKNVITGLWNGIKGMFGNLKSNVSSLGKSIISWVKGALSPITNAGKNLVQGLWNGISGAATWIKNKIKGWVGNVLSFVKGLFGIHSPSTEFAYFGKMNVLGLEKGMEDMQGDLNATISDMVNLSPSLLASASNSYNPNLNVQVVNNFETDPLGQVVNRIKSVSGGARSDYNVGMGANA